MNQPAHRMASPGRAGNWLRRWMPMVLLCTAAWAGAQERTGAPTPAAGRLDAQMAWERQDLGVAASAVLHAGALHGPTPNQIPGGQVITTQGLVALVQGRRVPFVLFDVLGQPDTLPGAVPAAWLAEAGSFNDAVQRRAAALFEQRTQGRKDVALVFYCLSRECWMSYNAALRAIRAGYTNVLWYRGGIEAWTQAGLPTQQGAQGAPAGSPQRPPSAFVQIQPLRHEAAAMAAPRRAAAELQIGQSQFFSFAMPEGWRIGEDGQFALTLVSPDNKALTLVVGNAGMPPNHAPARFAYEKLSAMQPQGLSIGAPRPARPASGFAQAQEFDVGYVVRGVAYRGVAKVSVAPAYDTATMAMTAALAPADQWAGYATWLPQVADQIAARNGAAFGMRGLMQQNLQNSVAFGEAARQYRDWSQRNWQQVTDERNASQDRRNTGVREVLGGVQTYANPYGASQAVELPTTYSHYWTDRQGRVVGTDDPSADPNQGSANEWRRMQRVAR